MTYQYQVNSEDSAQALGSGGLQVLATPRLVAWLENAAYRELQSTLSDPMTSVGASISLDHLAPSKIGANIEIKIIETVRDGKLVTFTLEAWDNDLIIGRARHTRAIIDQDKFMDRLNNRKF